MELRIRQPRTFVTSTFPGDLVLVLRMLFLFSFLTDSDSVHVLYFLSKNKIEPSNIIFYDYFDIRDTDT